MHNTIGVLPTHLEAGVGEDPLHRAVLRKHLGDKAYDSCFASPGREVFQQHRSHAPALMGILHDKGDLGV